MNLEERFWSKVNIKGRDDCWEWQAAIRNGYGCMKFDGKIRDSHRISWFLAHGKFPELLVCHKCDNRKCVNPNHLFVGTHSDNSKDAYEKGRVKMPENKPSGEISGMSKFSNKQVLEMLDMYHNKNYPPRTIIKIYGISRRQITGIVSGEYRKEQYNFFFGI